MLNKQKGNMYGFVTHTWNPIKGKCSHDCSYCYMKVFPQGKLRLDEKDLKIDLGENNFIFVGSSTDMFADNVPEEWIKRVLWQCSLFSNKYLFQSKNPKRMFEFEKDLPKSGVVATTIESDCNYKYSNAPFMEERAYWLKEIKRTRMITIEPIMDFNLKVLPLLIFKTKPKWVNIGADSKGHNLPEPSWEKVQELIKELEKFTEVKVKDNLKRLKGRRKER